MRKVFLDELPKVNRSGKECIDWKNCCGYIVQFEYEEYVGEVEIISYIKDRQTVVIKYKDNSFNIDTKSFADCNFAHIVGLVSQDFKYAVGENIIDDKRNLTILSRERKNTGESKNYHFKCNICKWEFGYISEGNLVKGIGCSCCAGHTVVEGINDITTTAPWMIPYFRDGYNEAKLYCPHSDKKIYPICPDCGRLKKEKISISKINKANSIGCVCSDGISYPEKFIHELLAQSCDFKHQYSSKDDLWCVNFRYDFSITNESCILEVHGEQHYKDCGRGRTLEEEQENDKLKEKLAIENGIQHYIILDCRKSELEWIKKSVLESELPTLLNFTEDDIDWLKCHEFACQNLIKIVCDYKKINNDLSPSDIGEVFKLTPETIRKYLKQGTLLGWCNYDAETGRQIGYKKAIAKLSKRVEMFKEETSLGIFNSTTELSNKSQELFGVYLHISGISNVCCFREDTYKGFVFRFVD